MVRISLTGTSAVVHPLTCTVGIVISSVGIVVVNNSAGVVIIVGICNIIGVGASIAVGNKLMEFPGETANISVGASLAPEISGLVI